MHAVIKMRSVIYTRPPPPLRVLDPSVLTTCMTVWMGIVPGELFGVVVQG